MKRFLVLLGVVCLVLVHPHRSCAQRQGDWSEELSLAVTDPASVLEESREGMWLVEARCLSVTADDNKIAQWQIGHVFNGPPKLQGKKFTLGHRQKPFPDLPMRGSRLPFVPEINESALWVMLLEGEEVRLPTSSLGGTLWSGRFISRAYNTVFPVGHNHPRPVGGTGFASYAEALDYARSIERLVRGKPEAQLPLLEEYARSSSPIKSVCAIATLGQSGIAGTPTFLHELVRTPGLSIKQQVLLDEVVDGLDGKEGVKWSRAPERVILWENLVSGSANEDQTSAIVGALDHISTDEGLERKATLKENREYAPPLSGEQLFAWLRTASVNTKWPVKGRSAALGAMGALVEAQLVPRGQIWDYLLSYVQKHPDFIEPGQAAKTTTEGELDTSLAEGALQGLLDFRPFTPQERATLIALSAPAQSSRWRHTFKFLLK